MVTTRGLGAARTKSCFPTLLSLTLNLARPVFLGRLRTGILVTGTGLLTAAGRGPETRDMEPASAKPCASHVSPFSARPKPSPQTTLMIGFLPACPAVVSSGAFPQSRRHVPCTQLFVWQTVVPGGTDARSMSQGVLSGCSWHAEEQREKGVPFAAPASHASPTSTSTTPLPHRLAAVASPSTQRPPSEVESVAIGPSSTAPDAMLNLKNSPVRKSPLQNDEPSGSRFSVNQPSSFGVS